MRRARQRVTTVRQGNMPDFLVHGIARIVLAARYHRRVLDFALDVQQVHITREQGTPCANLVDKIRISR